MRGRWSGGCRYRGKREGRRNPLEGVLNPGNARRNVRGVDVRDLLVAKVEDRRRFDVKVKDAGGLHVKVKGQGRLRVKVKVRGCLHVKVNGRGCLHVERQ